MLAEVSLTQQQYRAHLRRSRRTEVAGEGVLHCDVRAYLLSAPRWVLALVKGVFFGAGLTVFSLVSTGPPLGRRRRERRGRGRLLRRGDGPYRTSVEQARQGSLRVDCN